MPERNSRLCRRYPVQNVGAYGAEISQVLKRVQLYNRETKTWEWVLPEALDLAYRYSNLKFTNRAVVTAVEFQLRTDGLSAQLRFGELARRIGVTAEEVTVAASAAEKVKIPPPPADPLLMCAMRCCN